MTQTFLKNQFGIFNKLKIQSTDLMINWVGAREEEHWRGRERT